MERRSKIEIMQDVLRTIQSKDNLARPTHILYGANLSHDRLKKHLDLMLEQGFIERKEVKGEAFYASTQKGLEFLSGYNKMKRFFDAFGVKI